MSYEQFREQCAKEIEAACTDGQMHCCHAFAVDLSEKIRALPLPEVNEDPYAYVIGSLEEHGTVGNLSWEPDPKKASFPLYLLPLDADALRKENAELREVLELAKNGLQWYHREYPPHPHVRGLINTEDFDVLRRIDAALKGGEA